LGWVTNVGDRCEATAASNAKPGSASKQIPTGEYLLRVGLIGLNLPEAGLFSWSGKEFITIRCQYQWITGLSLVSEDNKAHRGIESLCLIECI
jgi:hypothetical protein